MREDLLREQAYLLWEQAGRPCGDGVEFWLQAEANRTQNFLIDLEEVAASLKPKRSPKPVKKAAKVSASKKKNS